LTLAVDIFFSFNPDALARAGVAVAGSESAPRTVRPPSVVTAHTR